MYMNVYLFEKSITALQQQKYYREMEIIVQDCILTSIRESIPTEEIIRAYLDESVEREEEVVIENVEEPELVKGAESEDDADKDKEDKAKDQEEKIESVPSIKNIDEETVTTKLSFNDFDSVMNDDNTVESVNAPKTIERLEEISMERAIQRKLEEEDDEQDKLKIDSGENIDLGMLDIFDLTGTSSTGGPKEEVNLLDDIIEL
jgi:hypothetical protein